MVSTRAIMVSAPLPLDTLYRLTLGCLRRRWPRAVWQPQDRDDGYDLTAAVVAIPTDSFFLYRDRETFAAWQGDASPRLEGPRMYWFIFYPQGDLDPGVEIICPVEDPDVAVIAGDLRRIFHINACFV